MKIGDKVKFVSEVGGGKVAGFQGNNIVLVEDEDGFQIPTPINDVVVVNEENYSTSKIVADKVQKKGIQIPDDDFDYDPSERPVTFKAPAEERKGGDKLNAYIAFVPMDVKAITSSRFETYIVNDSNYYIHYIYMTAEGNSWTLRAAGEVDPNTKLFVEEFGREDLAAMEHITVQLIAYKRKKPFLKKAVIDSEFRIDPVKFYKLHTFEENDFFEQPALIHTIVENDQLPRPLVNDPKTLKKEMMQKVKADMARPVSHAPKPKDDKDAPIVVDLHINALLDSTAGMSNSDILNYQLEKVRNTIFEYKNQKGRKIVFIHGKGEGVLRQAVIHELRYRFKNMPYQDASFQEYGYGATQVTIK